jgi:hypothetical protein
VRNTVSAFLVGRTLQLVGLVFIAHYLALDYTWGWVLIGAAIGLFGVVLEADAFMVGEDETSPRTPSGVDDEALDVPIGAPTMHFSDGFVPGEAEFSLSSEEEPPAKPFPPI